MDADVLVGLIAGTGQQWYQPAEGETGTFCSQQRVPSWETAEKMFEKNEVSTWEKSSAAGANCLN